MSFELTDDSGIRTVNQSKSPTRKQYPQSTKNCLSVSPNATELGTVKESPHSKSSSSQFFESVQKMRDNEPLKVTQKKPVETRFEEQEHF